MNLEFVRQAECKFGDGWVELRAKLRAFWALTSTIPLSSASEIEEVILPSLKQVFPRECERIGDQLSRKLETLATCIYDPPSGLAVECLRDGVVYVLRRGDIDRATLFLHVEADGACWLSAGGGVTLRDVHFVSAAQSELKIPKPRGNVGGRDARWSEYVQELRADVTGEPQKFIHLNSKAEVYRELSKLAHETDSDKAKKHCERDTKSKAAVDEILKKIKAHTAKQQ